MTYKSNTPDFLFKSAPTAARNLLGWELYVREADGSLTGGIIIETEAYTNDDEASHSFKGKTQRNSAMFDEAGTIYVYFTYGLHWCCNIVTGPNGKGEAVLIRAILPLKNISLMQSRRKIVGEKGLCDGPAKLCQALHVTGADNGNRIDEKRFVLQRPSAPVNASSISVSTRIGIRRGQDKLWHFILNESKR